MTTNNTAVNTNINTNLTITPHPHVLAFFASSIDADDANHYSQHLDGNLEIGSKYIDKSASSMALRYMYAASLVFTGVINVELDLVDAIPDKAVANAMKATRIFYTSTGRLLDYNRNNMMREFAYAVAGIADELRISRDRRHELISETKFYKGTHHESLADMNGYDGPPRKKILFLAELVTACWQAAAQSIVSHLPAAEREDAADEACRVMTGVTDTLGKLYTLAKNSSDERKRWELGYGAVDRAVLECIGLITRAMKWVDRMDLDDSFSGAIREDSVEALRYIGENQVKQAAGRMEVLSSAAYCFAKSDLVLYGRATGGMAPALEIRLHAPGSAFLGV